eukprot:CAMPEP_0113955840 /NCGR_PEP_ID=MMETSP0011_2-20120614/1651_1 /TAXON_ID=101924 /ORGANISM="Rhodosorus marinus" /LENGTH=265 /DNA_ID=CAMNT_0000965763 /DNA_START=259 /DNA_END=1053 /DNA_ORIENTATION=+ /assembly_acc=CAM_ASM_000156
MAKVGHSALRDITNRPRPARNLVDKVGSDRVVPVRGSEDLVLSEECIRDVILTLQRSERMYRVSRDYLADVQKDISKSMRSLLVDWLIEVSEEYRLLPETLHLAMNYLDRFLQMVCVDRSRLQLVGLSCLLLASKVEEVYPPLVDDLVFICDYTYTREEVIEMESLVVSTLEFRLTVTTMFPFMHILLRACVVDSRLDQLASFLADLSLLNYSLVTYLPSTIAAACVYVARRSLNMPGWNDELERASNLVLRDIQNPARELLIQW